jgi:ferrous iron transport protein A
MPFVPTRFMKELPVGGRATITGYASHNDFTERLREFGLVEGTLIRLLRRAPFGGPVEIQYGHTQIVLRPSELSHLQVQAVA